MSNEGSVPEQNNDEQDKTEAGPEVSEEATVPNSPTETKLKVDVLLKPAGNAPIMKKKKWTVERMKNIAYISNFIKKCINMAPNESVFLYVNQSFSPAPDTEVGTVFDCFGSDGRLVLHYCQTQAWG